MKKIKQLLLSWLEAKTKEVALRVVAVNNEDVRNQMYREAGKPIEELSCLYPAEPKQAAIMFEEWCKGILSECSPDEEALRRYAAFTAQPSEFHKWRYRNGGFSFLFRILSIIEEEMELPEGRSKLITLWANSGPQNEPHEFKFDFSKLSALKNIRLIGSIWRQIKADESHAMINKENIRMLVGNRLVTDFYDLMETIAE